MNTLPAILIAVALLGADQPPSSAAESVPVPAVAAAPSADPLTAKLLAEMAATVEVRLAFEPVIARIQGWLDRGYYAGASLVVVQDGGILFRSYFGDHGEATVEYIASAGKWLAAATIMAVADEGRLRLDDPAGKWIPELGATMGRATLRQLLAHTSGYPPYQPDGQRRDDYQTLVESVAHIAPLAALSDPGTHWNYGGLAMQVAGRMAELATGEEWEALFQRAIAKPLGMSDTHFTPVDPGNGHSPMLGGGARSSLRDYSRFLAMLVAGGSVDGKRILSPESVAQLQADQVGEAAIPPGNFVTAVRGAAHHGIYGLGEWRELIDAAGAALLVSSPSWAGTYPWIDHRHRLYGFFLAHVRGTAAGKDHFNPMNASAELPVLVDQAVSTLPGR